MTTVTAKIQLTQQDRDALSAMSPMQLFQFMQRQGNNMVAQARRTIVKKGALAGDWPHLSEDYAKRKRKGKTPGHGKFNYAELRDTGEMFDSLVADVNITRTGASIELMARGERNQKLLLLHANGEGSLPKRDPSEEMDQFEARFAKELDKHLAGQRTG